VIHILTFSAETFEPHYGVNGREGDGDVFKEENIKAFKKFVLDNTDGKGKTQKNSTVNIRIPD
jgi:hypothetical protein